MKPSRVDLDAIHITKTYGGSLEGTPSKAFMIDVAKKTLTKMWGNRPTHMVIPEGDKLPAYQYCGWFNSYTPKNDSDAMGSHLCLIWWDDKIDIQKLNEFAAAYWGHAEDYDI